MSKTLRITSVLGAICVVALVVLPVVSGSGTNEQLQKILDTPSVVEKFQAQAGSARSSNDEDSPLVKQAQAFALYLNPPPPPKTPERKSKPRRSATPRPPGPVKAKFSLLGTSFYPLRPEMSLALIDEPGKGLRWVRQSSEVGHLIIEQVKDGEIVVRDGQRTFELVAERPKKVSLLKGERTDLRETPPNRSSVPVTTPRVRESRTRRTAARRAARKAPSRTIPEPTPEEIALIEQFMEETKNITNEDELAKKFEELLGGMNPGSRISENEANQLEQLGKELSDANEAKR
ncbi:MAG: hypothetical protein PVG93_02590 [Phycisphaerales bacterium]|jgi:hypothetical protein